MWRCFPKGRAIAVLWGAVAGFGWWGLSYAECLDFEACQAACDEGDLVACVAQGLLDPNPDTAFATLHTLCEDPRLKGAPKARACGAVLALRCEIDPEGCLSDCDAKDLGACLTIAKYLQFMEGIEPSIPPFSAACDLGSAEGCDEAALATAHLELSTSSKAQMFARRAFDLYAHTCAAEGGRACDRALSLARQFKLQDQRIEQVKAKGCSEGVVFDCAGGP